MLNRSQAPVPLRQLRLLAARGDHDVSKQAREHHVEYVVQWKNLQITKMTVFVYYHTTGCNKSIQVFLSTLYKPARVVSL
jgi:hypothetical protein